MNRWLAASLACAASLYGADAHAASARLIYDPSEPRVAFAARELEASLRARGYSSEHQPLAGPAASPPTPNAEPSLRVLFLTREQARQRPAPASVTKPASSLRAEGFVLVRAGSPSARELWVIGADVAGEMYGGLELAEEVRTLGLDAIPPLTQQSPYLALRGTKFNLPLDVRTPSYSDMSDSAQAALADVWDFEFWRSYLDQLARDRYNLVSLWNEHPFPSLVRVPEYPDVALSNVQRSKARFDEDYPTTGTGLVTPAMLAHVETLYELTIDEKIAFWRRVMRYAKDRNIDVQLITWNIFTYGVDGKYGITDAIDNPKTVDYFRASVRALFRTYPLLRGIGLTTGENMGDASFEAKEAWAFATYGQGTLDAARAEPQRQFRFIHRQHQTRAGDIARTFQPLVESPNVDFVFSFKYAQAHALSSTRQTFHTEFAQSLGKLKTLWTLRNDDALLLRWAAPDFVREFIQNIPRDISAGYYVGSDMWVWAREFLDKQPRVPRQLEVDKHWLHFLLWGRLGYDPTLDNGRIVALVGQRFPNIDAARLLDAWQNASLIYPLVTGFHWGEYDFQWYIEGCRSRPGPAQTASGFHDVNRFISLGVHPGTDNIPIPAYVTSVVEGKAAKGTTPLQVADRISARADAALKTLDASLASASATRAAPPNDELQQTLGDIRAMAYLGQYYSAKIRGATSLALYRATRDAAHRERAIQSLTKAAQHWRAYTHQASLQYRNPVWTNRVGNVDWSELSAEVDKDIAIASAPLP
ncbi:MAG TPA: hypothetical protein VMG12_28695 [Polyangiaceae bacterium]|nr:hypothetical protein [Polyangiaceae bacterium]